jgi:hypothetical protein
MDECTMEKLKLVFDMLGSVPELEGQYEDTPINNQIVQFVKQVDSY